VSKGFGAEMGPGEPVNKDRDTDTGDDYVGFCELVGELSYVFCGFGRHCL